MISTSEFRKGLKIEINGEPFVMVDFQHVKPGKGGAFVRTRIKSLVTGNVLEKTFRSGEKLDSPDLEEKDMNFLYAQADEFTFMDSETYEQIIIDRAYLGDTPGYLQENCTVRVLFHNGQPIAVEVPTFVQLKVVKAAPGVKGDTATGASKPVTLETGKVIHVPLFINEGDILKVDTRTGEYVERL
jgi:elongation factor P